MRNNQTSLLFLMVLPVIIIWGCNFAVMKIGMNQIGPFLLASLRFLVASIPLIFFIKKPQIPFKFIIAYSLTFGLGQFGLLFSAIKLGLPSGMASLLVQLQVMFTPIFSLLILKQRISTPTVWAICLSLVGLLIIIYSTQDVSAELLPIILGCGAALSWALSNVVISWGKTQNYAYSPISLVVWASAMLPIPFLFMALFTGEFNQLSLTHLIYSLPSAFYLGVIATVIAYHFWVKALTNFPAAHVAPFSLLIPVIGLLLGSFMFDEVLSFYEILGCTFILIGLVCHVISLKSNQPSAVNDK